MNKEDHHKHLGLRATVHLIESLHLLQRQHTDRSEHSPDLPEGVILDIDSDEDDEVLFQSVRSTTRIEPDAVRT